MRVRGRPPSANGASSMHLRWGGLPAEPLVEVAAVLEVLVPPAVEALYFWALQASFVGGAGRRGAGHVGLQWHPGHPGGTAVNWGGYGAGGGELAGSKSALPSATGNVNTRDFRWSPGRPYRLAIAAAGDGTWEGRVDDTVVRHLHAGGTALADVVVWSEVFARCDDPSVTVRWRGFEAVTAGSRPVAPDRLAVSYQSYRAGGCDNTTAVPDPETGGVRQVTATERRVRPGTLLPVSRPPDR